MTFAGLDGEIGKVRQFYFGDQHWAVRYLMPYPGSWLTGRQLLIPPYALLAVNREEQNIGIGLDCRQSFTEQRQACLVGIQRGPKEDRR